MTKPNIILFFSDQQRWDTVGVYGNGMGITPNLDKMAQEGVRFEHAFSCQPVCGPARACLQTGKYATESGNFRNCIALPQTEKTIAHWMSEAGYEVGYIGKWHLATTWNLPGHEEADYVTNPVPPERRGGWRDYWLASDTLEYTSHGYDGYMFDADMNKVEFKGYRADCETDFAIEYLRTRDLEKPFFLFLSYIEPHQQNDRAHFEGPEGSKERFRDFDVPGDLVGTEGNWREEFPDYLGCCASLDYNLGRIREELEKLGLADNTLIIYTSDHGCHFVTRNREYKRSCHEASIRIPMIACGPGFTGGKVVDDLVSLIDIPPTFLAAGGVDKPDCMRGRPLQQLADGSADGWPHDVFVQISETQIGRALRTDRWKYSVRAPVDDPAILINTPKSDVYVEDFLYDLHCDPHERNNLVADPAYADVRRELRGRLRRYIVEVEGYEPEIRCHA